MLSRLSIRGKLQAVILVTTGATLALTCAAFIGYEVLTAKAGEKRRLQSIAEIIADANQSAMMFGDTNAALSALAPVRAQHEILAVVLYDREGNIFAQYRAPDAGADIPRQPPAFLMREVNGVVELTTPVRDRDDTYGLLYLRADLERIYRRIAQYALIAFAVFMGAMAAAVLIGRVLQQTISRPILGLMNTARAVAERHDYSVRAQKESDDELGLLTDAINEMLAVIHHNQERLAAAQADLERANRHLEATVADRTAALRETVAQLETFSYSVTHDMRGPLRAMISFSQLLQTEHAASLNAEAKDYLSRITDSARRLDRLIQDVLQYSRVARDELKLEPVDLGKLTREIVEQYPDIAEHREEIVIDEACSGATVLASTAALTQVISNLLTNALKFMPQGRVPEVRVSCEPRGTRVRVVVSDNGIGIPSSMINKIFGVFERLHGAEYPGTGIGLSIVKKAVERMGGEVGVESEPRRGSRFWFELPKA